MKTSAWTVVGVGVAIVLAVLTAAGIVAMPRSFYVPSGSMEPTLKTGATVRVRYGVYKTISDVRRGDIIVHSVAKTAPGASGIKRVVALSGDRVRTAGTQIWINGRLLPHMLMRRLKKVTVLRETNAGATYAVQYGDNVAPAPPYSGVVPAGHVFCLGDNRDNANDSRYTGAVPFASIIGKRVP